MYTGSIWGVWVCVIWFYLIILFWRNVCGDMLWKRALWRRRIDAKYSSMWGVGVLLVCRGLMGLVYGNISRRGGISFILLSSLRWGTVLVLNFDVIPGVRDFLWKITSQKYTILLVTRTPQWLNCYHPQWQTTIGISILFNRFKIGS